MSIVIDDPETERLAREIAAETGESVQQAIRRVLRDRHQKQTASTEQDEADRRRRLAETKRLIAQLATLPVYDDRSPDEIIGYDDDGLPT